VRCRLRRRATFAASRTSSASRRPKAVKREERLTGALSRTTRRPGVWARGLGGVLQHRQAHAFIVARARKETL
jgi:hypothetical protein